MQAKALPLGDTLAWNALASVQWYWWQLLSGAAGTEAAKIEKLHQSHEFKSEGDAYKLLITSLLTSYNARAQSLKGQKIKALSNYKAAAQLMPQIEKHKGRYEELHLLSLIYQASVQYAGGQMAYRPFTWMLPSVPKKAAYPALLKLQNSASPFVQAQALYFSFKLGIVDESYREESRTALSKLCKLYPGNVVYAIEYFLNFERDQQNSASIYHALENRILTHPHLTLRARKHFLQSLSHQSSF